MSLHILIVNMLEAEFTFNEIIQSKIIRFLETS